MESGTTFFLIVAVIGLVCGMICSSIAERKGRNSGGWFVLGLFFGPLAVLVAAATSSEQPQVPDVVGSTIEPDGMIADQLATLADLHGRGGLTDDEFATAKARILG